MENKTMDAMSVALALAITASTDAKAAAAVEIAEGIARSLTHDQVAECKRMAIFRAETYNFTF